MVFFDEAFLFFLLAATVSRTTSLACINAEWEAGVLVSGGDGEESEDMVVEMRHARATS
jgi:hypothetical protein